AQARAPAPRRRGRLRARAPGWARRKDRGGARESGLHPVHLTGCRKYAGAGSRARGGAYRLISFALTEEQELIRDTARKLAAEEIRPRLGDLEAARGVPDALVAKLHALGVMLADLPAELGGEGCLTACLVHEELAAGDAGAAVALWAPHVLPAALVEL